MPPIQNRQAFQALQQLPKDTYILDYVRHKLSEKSSPEQVIFMTELLEMHRTSKGFDPLEHSKGRLKRVKSKEFKRLLFELNITIESIVNSPEYKEMIRHRKSFDSILNNYAILHEKFQKNRIDDEIREELRRLKKDLVEFEEYEILLAVYRMSQGYYEDHLTSSEIRGLMEEYNQVKVMAELSGEHTLLAMKTMQLVNEAEKGNRNNLALVNLYDSLCKLLMRQSSTKSKYETLTRIIKVATHLENRRYYMEPYMEFTRTHFEEIVDVLPDSAKDLNSALAVFLNREPIQIRMSYLNKAIEEAGKSRSNHDLALFKIIHVELCCDVNDYAGAVKMLDEADYIISRIRQENQMAEMILRSTTTRFYLLCFLLLQGRQKIESEMFTYLINKASNSGSQRHDLKIIEMEMLGMYHFVFGNYTDARSLFIKCVKARENQSSPVHYIIDSFMQELLRKTPDHELLHANLKQLDQLKETFYSSLWVRMLKEAIVKREVYGELVL